MAADGKIFVLDAESTVSAVSADTGAILWKANVKNADRDRNGGFGGDAAAPKAREIMRTILLKDPEIVARIQKSGQQITNAPDIGPAERDTADQPDLQPSVPLPDDGTRTQ